MCTELDDDQVWVPPSVCMAEAIQEKKHQNFPFSRIPTFPNISIVLLIIYIYGL